MDDDEGIYTCKLFFSIIVFSILTTPTLLTPHAIYPFTRRGLARKVPPVLLDKLGWAHYSTDTDWPGSTLF